jgi:hypothetical protein
MTVPFVVHDLRQRKEYMKDPKYLSNPYVTELKREKKTACYKRAEIHLNFLR